jgi:hypothetical protein
MCEDAASSDSLPARLVELGKTAQYAIDTQNETAWTASQPTIVLFAHDFLVGAGYSVVPKRGLSDPKIAWEFVNNLTRSERDCLNTTLRIEPIADTVIVQTLRDTLAKVPNLRTSDHSNFVDTVLGACVPENAGTLGHCSLDRISAALKVSRTWTTRGKEANARCVIRMLVDMIGGLTLLDGRMTKERKICVLCAHSLHKRLEAKEKLHVSIVRKRIGKCFESRKLAYKYWGSDDLCRASPQKDDVLKVRRPDGTVIRLPRMWLECTPREAFSRFERTYPEVRIGLSTFLTCRPANVKRFKAANRVSCACRY